MEHAPLGDEDDDDVGCDDDGHGDVGGGGHEGGICRWLGDGEADALKQGATGLWVNVFNDVQSRSGQVR